jgi:hypothetical protein
MGLLEATTRREEPAVDAIAQVDDGAGGEDEAPKPEKAPTVRRRRAASKKGEPMESRRVYLTEGVHFRLRMFALAKRITLSAAAEEILDRGLPHYEVKRVG